MAIMAVSYVVSTQYANMAHTQEASQTLSPTGIARRHRPRLCITSRDKNQEAHRPCYTRLDRHLCCAGNKCCFCPSVRLSIRRAHSE